MRFRTGCFAFFSGAVWGCLWMDAGPLRCNLPLTSLRRRSNLRPNIIDIPVLPLRSLQADMGRIAAFGCLLRWWRADLLVALAEQVAACATLC